MRISDWSSDVCSSDLRELVQAGKGLLGRGMPVQHQAQALQAGLVFGLLPGPVVVEAVAGEARAEGAARRDLTDLQRRAVDGRSAERRVGKECVSTGRSRWSPDH